MPSPPPPTPDSVNDDTDPLPSVSHTSTSTNLPLTTSHRRGKLESLRLFLAMKLEPSLTLENQGSVARDHLASERTFLAYVRTSLAIASTGVALVQLFTISATTTNPATKQLQAYARPLGASTIIVGICVLIIGISRFFSIQKALVGGFYPAARITVAAVAFALGALIATVFSIIVSGER